MNIEKLLIEDLPFLDALQPKDWSDIKPKFSDFILEENAHPIKIVLDQQIVGLGVSIIHEDTAWLASIIVHPEFRKKGLGQIITNEVIKISKDHGCETIYLIATYLGKQVYTKLGFVSETIYRFYKNIDLRGFPTSKNIYPIEDSIIKDILAIDRKCSGENRKISLSPQLDTGFAYINNSTVEGFYLPDLGNGVIIALDETAGLELMKLRLQSKNKAIFPMENKIASQFLNSHGFDFDEEQDRMRLGPKREHQLASIYNRIGGYLG